MTPEFSEAVDPIFMHVLRLLERIERGESPSPKEERQRILGWINQGEAHMGQSQDWELAKYALVAWVDDLLIESAWDGQAFWNENALERELFGYREAFDLFFPRAREASALPKRNALEVFYVCVVLGFRGPYRDPLENAGYIERQGLPADLETWAQQTSRALRLGQGLPRIAETGRRAESAPALEQQSSFITNLLIGIVLAALNVILLVLVFLK